MFAPEAMVGWVEKIIILKILSHLTKDCSFKYFTDYREQSYWVIVLWKENVSFFVKRNDFGKFPLFRKYLLFDREVDKVGNGR